MIIKIFHIHKIFGIFELKKIFHKNIWNIWNI
jgi:hypothetical protein